MKSNESQIKEYKLIKLKEGHVWVSRDGTIQLYRGRKNVKIYHCQQHDYPVVYIYGTTYMVHKLVALAWCPLPEGVTYDQVMDSFKNRIYVVDHIDGDKDNYHCSNLRWCTSYENLHFNNMGNRHPGARKGNQHAAKPHKKPSTPKQYKYTYYLDGQPYDIHTLTAKLKCSKSCITEAFRKNYGLVRMGRLTRE